MAGFAVKEINSSWVGVAKFDSKRINPRYKVIGSDGSIRFVPYISLFDYYEADLVQFAGAKAEKYAKDLRPWYKDMEREGQ